MEGENGVSQSILDELPCSYIQRDQMEGKGGVSRSIIDPLLSSDMVHLKVGVVLLEVLLMNFFIGISKGIKWKMKVV